MHREVMPLFRSLRFLNKNTTALSKNSVAVSRMAVVSCSRFQFIQYLGRMTIYSGTQIEASSNTAT